MTSTSRSEGNSLRGYGGRPNPTHSTSTYTVSPEIEKHRGTEDEEKKLLKAMEKYGEGKSRGSTASALKSVADELLTVVTDNLGVYGLIFKIYLLINDRMKTMKAVSEKAIRLRKEAEQLVEYYEKNMAIRFISNSDYGQIIDQEAVELFSHCFAVVVRSDAEEKRSISVNWIQGSRRLFHNYASATDNDADIDDCVGRMQKFRLNLLLTDRARPRSNVRPHIEGDTVGLETRYGVSKVVSAVESGSKYGKIQIVYLYGARGVGKSRVLNEIFVRLSNFPKTYLIDCSRSGTDDPSEPLVQWWQKKLIEQMVDAVSTEGLASVNVGKQKLIDYAQFWKRDDQKVLLALDNIAEGRLLSQMLPDSFSKYLPKGSCVLISVEGDFEHEDLKISPAFRNIKAIFRDLPDCPCVYKPLHVDRLQFYEAKELISKYTKGPGHTDESTRSTTWQDLVSRCEGLPVLLLFFGKYFEIDRPVAVWQRICEELAAVDEDIAKRDWGPTLTQVEDRVKEEVARAQEVAYIRLVEKMGLLFNRKLESSLLQEAMGDIANVFNGWSWGTVENILGRHVLKELKDKRVILSKEIIGTQTLTRLAEITRNYGSGPWKMKVLLAAPEMLESGRKLHRDHHIHAVESPMPQQLTELRNRVKRSCRSLCLIDCENPFEMKWMENLEGLRYVVIEKTEVVGSSFRSLADLRFLHFGTGNPASESRPQSLPFRSEHLENLSVLVLSGLSFGGAAFQVPRHLVSLSLIGCTNLRQAAPSIFRSESITSLHLQACDNLYDLPIQRPNATLSKLSIQLSADLEYIPEFVYKLENLTTLELLSCPKLVGQVLEEPHGRFTDPRAKDTAECLALKELIINDCHSMTCLPSSIVAFSNVSLISLDFCSNLERLPSQMQIFHKLKHLDLQWCTSLECLPTEICELETLQKLNLLACWKLRNLPRGIGRLKNLQNLDMNHCFQLQSLPKEIENLKSLRRLSMSWCTQLTEENGERPKLSRLPNLKYLNVIGLRPTYAADLLIDLESSKRLSTMVVEKVIPNQNHHSWISYISEPAKDAEKTAKQSFLSDNRPSRPDPS